MNERIILGEQCAVSSDYPIDRFPKVRIWELRARLSMGDSCAVARHTPRYISLKQPSGLSKGRQVTPQGSLLLDELYWLASHPSYPSRLGFHAAGTASVALAGAS